MRFLLKIATKKGEKYTVDLDNIKIEKKAGASIQDTELIKGIILDKEVIQKSNYMFICAKSSIKCSYFPDIFIERGHNISIPCLKVYDIEFCNDLS